MAATPEHWPSARPRNEETPHLVVLRFALFNVVAAGLAFAIYLQGWLDAAFRDFTLWLSLAIIGVFLFGLALCAERVWRTSMELADLAAGAPRPDSRARALAATFERGLLEDRPVAVQLLRLRMSGHIAIVLHTANSLVFLGLVGTVIGFIVALSGVDPQLAGQVDNVGPMVSTLLSGMSIALYTTLIGALLHLWLVVNYRLLASATLRLFGAIVEAGG